MRLAIGRTGTLSRTPSAPSVRGFPPPRSSSSAARRLPLPFCAAVSNEEMRTSPSSTSIIAKSPSVLSLRPVPNPLVVMLVPNGCETESASAEVAGTEMGTSWNARAEELAGGTGFEEGMELMPFMGEESTELEAREHWLYAFLRLALRHERVDVLAARSRMCVGGTAKVLHLRARRWWGRHVAAVLDWAWFRLD